MKFKITATSIWNMDDEVFYKEIAEKYPCLKEFGFDNGYITIDSLQDLMKLKEAVCVRDKYNELIVSGIMDDPLIEIYDAYRE